MDAPLSISSQPPSPHPARQTSPTREARMKNLMQLNHQRQVTIVHERNKKVLPAYVATRNDAENKLQLKGHCQYIKELQRKPKNISTLSPQQQEAYQTEKDTKDTYDQLFFRTVDEYIVDATQINWWKQEIVALLIRDHSAPVKLSENPDFCSFEAFVIFIASLKKERSPMEKAVLAANWIVEWNKLQTSRFLNDDKLRITIAQIVNKEYIESYQDKTRDWVKIKNYLALGKITQKLAIKPETMVRFGEINTVLHSIVEHLEYFTKLMRMEPVSTLLNEKAKQPSAHRMFMHYCVMAKYHGEFDRIVAHVLALFNPPASHSPIPDGYEPSRVLQKLLQADTNDQVIQVIQAFSNFNYQSIAKINQELRQLVHHWNKDLQSTLSVANRESVDVSENRQLIDDYKVAISPNSDFLSQIDPHVLSSLLKDADIELLNSFIKLPSLKDYAHYWAGKEVTQLKKNPCVLITLKNFKYMPIMMTLMNQIAIKLGVKKLEDKGTGSSAILQALKKDNMDSTDPLEKDIDKIYQLMHENFSLYCKESLGETEPGSLFNQFITTVRGEIRGHFKHFFKQYERHSAIRFEEMVAIHHRYKQNLGLLLDIIPANHPEGANIRKQFLDYILSILEKSKNNKENGRSVFNYRKIQAGCSKTTPSGLDCEVKLKQLQGMLRLFNMHIIKNSDYTASKMSLGHMEEAHHVAFPYLFNQSTLEQETSPNEITRVAIAAVKGYQEDTGICFHKEIVDERGWLDVNKFDEAFKELRKEIQSEVSRLGPFADPKHILHQLITGYTFVNMGAMHESSQTLHLLSIANQELDSLSERKIENVFYKAALAESLKKMLISQQKESILHFYQWYYDGTVKATEAFQSKITGLKSAVKTTQKNNTPHSGLFIEDDKNTLLCDYFNEEKRFLEVINPILKAIKAQSYDSNDCFINGLVFIHTMANRTTINPEQIRQLINRVIHEASTIDESDVEKMKSFRNSLVNLLVEKKPFDEIVKQTRLTPAKNRLMISEENLEKLDEYFKSKKRYSFKYTPGLTQEVALKKIGSQLMNMTLLCLSQRIMTSVALKKPGVSRIIVEPFKKALEPVQIITTSTSQTQENPSNQPGTDSP